MEVIQGGSKLTPTGNSEPDSQLTSHTCIITLCLQCGSHTCFVLVKSQLFRVLGVLAEVFFDKMLDHHNRLLDIYMKSLKQEVSRL